MLFAVVFLAALVPVPSRRGLLNRTAVSGLNGATPARRVESYGQIASECKSFLVTYSNDGELQGDDTRKGAAGGEWSPCTHLATYGLNFAPFFGRFLSFQLQPRTVLEFGCGLGTTSDYVARMSGAEATCIEPDPTLGTLIASLRGDNKGSGQLRQLSVNIFDDGAKACAEALKSSKYDLVFSLEVAEHVPLEFHKHLVDLLTSATGKYLVFSAARPDQAGTGHLPESMFPREVWVQTFKDAGMVYLDKLTQIARRTAYPLRGYDIYGNVMIFGNADNSEVADTDVVVDQVLKFSDLYGSDNDNYAKKDYGDLVRAHAAGSNQAMWPGLALMEKQAKDGTICKTGPSSLMGAAAGVEGRHRPLSTEVSAFESAWAAHFYRHAAKGRLSRRESGDEAVG
mmetsp:Transcript_62295/g.173765  ORF Transcript_62295/g.173765 Transcript_62295/m.173765 type:complete len:398 (+) Transcript_62295:74-1267(+)|eukprot:CAMPEP_0117490018 /NCGR_PEP_ID=MMETSP0784-20121206/17336_1 /TAXON_ID=39447 /ORGANISM="" /LENGTH=397 /DNA_ID=CAMNT_0005284767 /DNA_START=81 /DNA_END=1274 /DNA_ORIENTATION=+